MTVGGGAGFFGAPPDILLSVDDFEGGGWLVCVWEGEEGGGGDSITNQDFTYVIELLHNIKIEVW